MLTVSHSKVKTWRRCRFAYNQKYIHNLVPKRKKRALLMGGYIHDGTEAIAQGKDWIKVVDKCQKEYDKTFIEEKMELGDLPADLERILEGYEAKYKKDKLKYLGVEIKFTVPLIPGIADFTGRVDGQVKDRQKTVWLKETKSFTNMPKEEVRFTDQQTILYCWAIPQIGLPVSRGVMWDYVRSKPPTLPQVLQNGSLSKAKKINTTYAAYLGEIKRRGLNPKDYRDILDDLKDRPDDWYRRIYLPAQDSLMHIFMRDMRETAWEIYHLEGTSKARNVTWECPRCDYYSLCQAELRDLDVDYIIEKEYKERREEDDQTSKEIGEED